MKVTLVEVGPVAADSSPRRQTLAPSARTMRMLDAFLLHCLLRESPSDTPQELGAIARNKQRVAARGREPGLRLEKDGADVTLAEWGAQVLAECETIAIALDTVHGSAAHRDAYSSAVRTVNDPAATPSARVLRSMERDHGNSYVRFVLAQSIAHRESLLKLPWSSRIEERFARLAEESVARQRQIEASDTVDFETYRQRYLAPVRLNT